MNEPICDIKGLRLLNPVFYTPQFLFNPYTLANDLAKHLHVYGVEISRTDYGMIGSLNGNIRILEEGHQEQVFDGAVRSNPYNLWKNTFFFNEHMELLKILFEDRNEKNEVVFNKTLKNPKSLQIVKSTEGVSSQKNTVFFDRFLHYQRIEEFNFHDHSHKLWENQRPVVSKYLYRSDGTILRTLRTNAPEEQSKTSFEYNAGFQVQEIRSFDQKNKSQLLYEAKFQYGQNAFLKKVSFVRFNETKLDIDNRKNELNFEYDEKGLLTKFDGGFYSRTWEYDNHNNPVCIREINHDGSLVWETFHAYEYDKYNSWTRRATNVYRIDNHVKTKTKESWITRIYSYF